MAQRKSRAGASELVVSTGMSAAQALSGYRSDGAAAADNESLAENRLQSIDGAGSEHGELMSASFFDEEEGQVEMG